MLRHFAFSIDIVLLSSFFFAFLFFIFLTRSAEYKNTQTKYYELYVSVFNVFAYCYRKIDGVSRIDFMKRAHTRGITHKYAFLSLNE